MRKPSLFGQSCDFTGDESANTTLGEKQCETAFNLSAKEFVYSSARANPEANDEALRTESPNDISLAKSNDNT